MVKNADLSNAGFTLIELIMVLVLVGILSLFVLPRFFDRNTFDTRAFGDEMQSMLRYAQKLAIARNGPVYVCFTSNSISLGLDNACSELVLMASSKPATLNFPANVVLDTQTTFYFNALGRPFNKSDTAPTSTSSFAKRQIKLTGGEMPFTLFVESETGYVHQ